MASSCVTQVFPFILIASVSSRQGAMHHFVGAELKHMKALSLGLQREICNEVGNVTLDRNTEVPVHALS